MLGPLWTLHFDWTVFLTFYCVILWDKKLLVNLLKNGCFSSSFLIIIRPSFSGFEISDCSVSLDEILRDMLLRFN